MSICDPFGVCLFRAIDSSGLNRANKEGCPRRYIRSDSIASAISSVKLGMTSRIVCKAWTNHLLYAPEIVPGTKYRGNHDACTISVPSIDAGSVFVRLQFAARSSLDEGSARVIIKTQNRIHRQANVIAEKNFGYLTQPFDL